MSDIFFIKQIKLSHTNIANLLPVVSDFKGSRRGLIVPTYRHQLFHLDAFDDRALPITNFNRLTVASPGAGKSFFEQAQILDGLSRGQQIFVIDLGGSYKHLCDLVGGSYIDASTLTLNPFTLFDFDGVIAESVNVKTEAFSILYQPYGKDVVKKVVKHHLTNGGVSRFEKFKIYHKEFLNIELNGLGSVRLSELHSGHLLLLS